MPLLRLHDVSVVFPGDVHALRSVTLSVERGEFVVLLGRSGAGKSTLLRTLNYLTPPTSGTIETADIGTLSPTADLRRHRRRTAMIFQLHQLIGRHTALRNVETGRAGLRKGLMALLPLRRAQTRFCIECLDRVGLIEKALARVDQLSGGQRQRVGIARALAQEPEIMLADEPVASLDPESSYDILERLRRISDEDGLTTLVSLHQLDLARVFARRVIGLAGGEVVFDGPVEDLTEADLIKIYGGTRSAALFSGAASLSPFEEPDSLPPAQTAHAARDPEVTR